MIATDEDALACDMMETYRIADYRALPARRAALFASGLREDSRIRRKISGAPASLETLLLARIADSLAMLVWFGSSDGAEGINRPRSILAALRGDPAEGETVGFASAEDFEAWRASMLGE